MTPEPRRPPGIDSPQLAGLSEERQRLLKLRLAERGLDLAALNAAPAPAAPSIPAAAGAVRTRPGMSLIFFSADGSRRRRGAYALLLECARFADANGFEAIWVPERHFNPFGGLYPSPVALAAAIAATTENVAIRSGSVVLPLHSPVRVAEEWAVVDNLSDGRVGMSFASGWHPDDFVLRKSGWEDRRELTFSGIETIQRLWRGESVELENGVGAPAEIRIYPRPLQGELPIWITSAKTRETWQRAAKIGANVLTALLEQSAEEVGEHVAEYRRALAANGFEPGSRRVTLMLHTFVGTDLDQVRATVRPPMTRYLRSHMGLYEKMARSVDLDLDLDSISEADKETLVEAAFERYFGTHALFGTPRSAAQRLAELLAVGVDEIACLVDFGVEDAAVIAGLENLVAARELLGAEAAWGNPDGD